MKEETNEIMMAQARSGLIGSTNRAAAKDGKNARDLDAEMRKRRLAKNALLAVKCLQRNAVDDTIRSSSGGENENGRLSLQVLAARFYMLLSSLVVSLTYCVRWKLCRRFDTKTTPFLCGKFMWRECRQRR